jgi:hypothetical protein
MSVTVSCPSCGKAGNVPDAAVGMKVKCPQCGVRFQADPERGGVEVDQVGSGTPPAPWHYARHGQRLGPVDFAELERLAAAGELGADDLVWSPGMPAWVPASTIEGLACTPPPLPQGPKGGPATKPARLHGRALVWIGWVWCVLAVGVSVPLVCWFHASKYAASREYKVAEEERKIAAREADQFMKELDRLDDLESKTQDLYQAEDYRRQGEVEMEGYRAKSGKASAAEARRESASWRVYELRKASTLVHVGAFAVLLVFGSIGALLIHQGRKG